MTLSPTARALISHIAASAAARYEDAADDELVALLNAENPDLDKLVSALVRAEGEARAHVDGLKGYIASLEARKSAHQQRAGNARLTLMNIMDAVGVRQWRTAEATISLRDGTAGVLITEENAIPDRFFTVKRVANIAAIKDALSAGEEVPGVVAANGSPSITITRK